MDGDKLAQYVVRHALGSERFSKAQADKIVRVLNIADDQLEEIIAARVSLIVSKGYDRGPATTKRLEDTLEAIRAINRDVYARVGSETRGGLIDLAKQEIDFTNDAIKASGSADYKRLVPSSDFLATLVDISPIATDANGGGAILKSWIDKMESGRVQRLDEAIRGNLARGAGVDDIMRKIRGTKAENFSDGILNVSRRSAQTMALTANSTIQNAARNEVFRQSRIIKFVEWSSILDSRTSPGCQSLSSKIFALDEPHPTAPRHPRCRSILIPRKNNTDPPKHKTFEEWIKAQNRDVQDEAFAGRERGELYRSGTIKAGDLYRSNGTFKSIDELKAHDAKIIEKPKRFSTPINPSVTDASIVVRPKRQTVRDLSATLANNAGEPRYDPRPEFRSIKATDFGKAQLGSAFNDPACSMIEALMPEVDAITDAFAIPRLRAVKTGTGSYVATMGDGTLTINATYFNGYAANIGGKASKTVAAALIRDRDALVAELKAMSDELAQARIVLRDLTGAAKEKATHDYLDKAEVFKAKRAEWVKLDKKVLVARRTDAAAEKPVSTWKPGDQPNTRPYNATDYFAGIDRARNVMFHETAHHVHQMLGKTGRRSVVGAPPLERHLKKMFFDKFHGAGPAGVKGMQNKMLQPTTYATTNEFEWFAENFGLFMMGRKDLADPDIVALIERLLDEVRDART